MSQYNDYSPLPWEVDDNREPYAGLVSVFASDGKMVMAFGDIENCEWRDICDAHTIVERINAHEALTKRIADLEEALEEVTRWYTSLHNDVLNTVPEYAELCGDWNAVTYLFSQVQAHRARLEPPL